MKALFRLTSAVLGLAFFNLSAVTVQAQFSYVVTNDAIILTGYTGPGGDIAIPDTIDGLPVIAIGTAAFRYHSNLTRVTIPDGVAEIGNLAFGDCTSLASVTFGNGLTAIQGSAFSRCTSLATVKIPDSVTRVGDFAFSGCTSLTNVTIGRGVRRIGITIIEPWGEHCVGERAFASCTSLTAITVDPLNSVFSSADGVLFNKARTTLVAWPGGKTGAYSIPNSVTNLEESAFSDGTGLTSVAIPKHLTYIGNPGFVGCTSLGAITVDPLNAAYSSLDGILFNKSQTVLVKYPAARAGSYTIPDRITGLGFGAFAYCTRLTSVAVPHSLTAIERRAFAGCTGLTNVMFPSSLHSIGEQAFSYCANLTTVVIPSRLTYIGDGGFGHCTSLAAVYFQGNAPDSIWYWEWPFVASTNVTVYYLPGATGWGPTFAGRPTALWTLPPVADVRATRSPWVSPDGLSANVVLDGSRSSDPDGDALEYLWLSTLNSQPSIALATGAVAVVRLPIGVHPILLVVSDGLVAATNSITIEVITPAQAVQRLIAQVESSWRRSQPLVASLSAALRSIERGNAGSAANQLGAFQNKVSAQVAPSDRALAARFIQAAQDIIDALSGGNTNRGDRPHGRLKATRHQSSGDVQLQFTGVREAVCIVEASTDLMHWEKIGIAAEGGDGTFTFDDPNAAKFPNRFYRIVSP